MSQYKDALEFFRQNGNRVTLGQIMQTSLACEYRKLFSMMRGEGYQIQCKLNRKEPSLNEYTCVPPTQSGQMRFLS